MAQGWQGDAAEETTPDKNDQMKIVSKVNNGRKREMIFPEITTKMMQNVTRQIVRLNLDELKVKCWKEFRDLQPHSTYSIV